jgi:predicted DNA-binding transcriptional regulator AlpA
MSTKPREIPSPAELGKSLLRWELQAEIDKNLNDLRLFKG